MYQEIPLPSKIFLQSVVGIALTDLFISTIQDSICNQKHPTATNEISANNNFQNRSKDNQEDNCDVLMTSIQQEYSDSSKEEIQRLKRVGVLTAENEHRLDRSIREYTSENSPDDRESLKVIMTQESARIFCQLTLGFLTLKNGSQLTLSCA